MTILAYYNNLLSTQTDILKIYLKKSLIKMNLKTLIKKYLT